MDAGFVLALPFHHGDLEPDCVEVSTRGGGREGGEGRGGGAYARDKNTSARLCAKNAGGRGGLCARGGIFAGHYGTCIVPYIYPRLLMGFCKS